MNKTMISAYPLQWPVGWKRTSQYLQEHSKFKSTFAVARDELLMEVERLRGKWHRSGDAILSTNIELRQDGLPYANRREPEDSGVAIYFEYKKQQMCFACDKYHKVWENMVAIRKTIEAIRGIERWGASDMMEKAFQGFIALEDNSAESWRHVLNCDCSDLISAKRCYHAARKSAHPDHGGSTDKFHQVEQAWQQAQRELEA